MAGRRGARTVRGMTRLPPLVIAVGALVASYIVGAAIAAATEVGSLAAAAVNGTKLSAPSFMLVILTLCAVAFARGRRWAAIPLLAVSTLSAAAAAFDGDVGNEVLSPGHVVWQGLEVGLNLVVWVLALLALTRTRRHPAAV